MESVKDAKETRLPVSEYVDAIETMMRLLMKKDAEVFSMTQKNKESTATTNAPNSTDSTGVYRRSVVKRGTPTHHKWYGAESDPYETIKVIEAWNLSFTLGNALKYISRAGKRDNRADTVDDLRKALFYIQYEIDKIEGNKP